MNATVSPVKIHVLVNPWGWVLSYVENLSGPDWNTIRIVRRWKGEEAGELSVTRDEARAHYAAQLRSNFVRKIMI